MSDAFDGVYVLDGPDLDRALANAKTTEREWCVGVCKGWLKEATRLCGREVSLNFFETAIMHMEARIDLPPALRTNADTMP